MNKKINNAFAALILIINFTLMVFGIFVIFKVSAPLYAKEINEIDKKTVIGLKTSTKSEYDSELNPFWWVTNPKTELYFTNYSDELIVGKIILYYEENPCLSKGVFFLKYNKRETQINLSEENVTETYVEIPGRNRIVFELYSKGNINCKVNNGDLRNFIAKVKWWKFI